MLHPKGDIHRLPLSMRANEVRKHLRLYLIDAFLARRVDLWSVILAVCRELEELERADTMIRAGTPWGYLAAALHLRSWPPDEPGLN